MTVLPVALRRVRWLPLLLTVLAMPFVAVGATAEALVVAARWCAAAVVLGRDAVRERQRAG